MSIWVHYFVYFLAFVHKLLNPYFFFTLFQIQVYFGTHLEFKKKKKKRKKKAKCKINCSQMHTYSLTFIAYFKMVFIY